MDPIQTTVARCRMRIGINRASRILAWCLLCVAALALVMIVLDKLILLKHIPFYVILGGSIAALVVTAAVAIRRWPKRDFVAVEVDDRLHLGERISTAMALAQSADPMSTAVKLDAVAYAKNVPVSRAFPLKFHHQFTAAVALGAMAYAASLWIDNHDLFNRRKVIVAKQEEKAELAKRADVLKKDIAKMKKVVRENPSTEKIRGTLQELERLADEMKSGNISRGEALSKLNDLRKDLMEAQKDAAGQEAPTAGAPNKPLENLMQQQGPQDMTRGLAQALAAGDFQAAADKFNALADKAEQLADQAKNAPDPAARQQAQQQLQDLGKQMNQLAEAMKGMAPNQMNGMNPAQMQQLAQAMQQAAQNMNQQPNGQNPNPQAMQALAQAMQNAQGQLNDMAGDAQQQQAMMQALNNMMNQAGGQGQGQGQGVGGKALEDMLAKAGGDNGVFTPGAGQEMGAGMGGPGVGRGGVAPIAPHPVSFNPERDSTVTQEGKYMVSYFTGAGDIKAESKVSFEAAVTSAEADAARSVDNQPIPAHYRDFVHDYFDGLRPK